MLVSDPVSSSVAAEGETIFSHPKVVQIFKSFVGCRCCWLEKKTLLAVRRAGFEKALKSVRNSITCSAPGYWVRRYEGS